MANNLEMNLLLHDKFSSTMHKAQQSTEKLEKSLEKVNEFGKELIGSIGLGFGFFKLAEFAKESLKDFTETEKTLAKMETMMKNENRYSKEKLEILKLQREELLKMGVAGIESAKAQMLIQRNFGSSNQAFKNLAMESAVNFAGYGNDPSEAIESLQAQALKAARTGRLKGTDLDENSRNKLQEQFKTIGNEGQRVVLFLEAINKQYKGIFEAQKNADPLARVNQAKLEFSEHMEEVFGEVAKRLEAGTEKIFKFLDFFAEHTKGLANVITSVM